MNSAGDLQSEVIRLDEELAAERARSTRLLEAWNAEKLATAYANDRADREAMRADENAIELERIRKTGEVPDEWQSTLEAENVLKVNSAGPTASPIPPS